MKTSFIKFRISLFDKKILKLKAKKSGLSLSEFCRKTVFEKEVKERLTEEQIQFYKMLIKYHNNFKSIGNLFKNKDPLFSKKVNELAEEIKTHLNNYK